MTGWDSLTPTAGWLSFTCGRCDSAMEAEPATGGEMVIACAGCRDVSVIC
jgi:hypothetical protein